MSFGKIIKELRRKANMTQEELAEALNMSGQAISRWENDLAMPDVSLLPALSHLFNVTTDYLLEVDTTRKEEKIQSILHLATEKGKVGAHFEAAQMMRAGLREYPNNCPLMYGLMYHLHISATAQQTAQQRISCFEQATVLGEKILASCTDDELRHNTIDLLCSCYTALDRQEQMKKMAQAVPDIWKCREFLLARNTRGAEQLRAKRQQVCTLLSAGAITLAQLHWDQETHRTWEAMSSDEVVAEQKNALAIIDMLCPDGDYGSLNLTRLHAYYTLMDICFGAGNSEEGLAYLEQAVHLAICLDTQDDGNQKHTSPLFCGQAYGFLMPDMPIAYCSDMLSKLTKQRYFAHLNRTEKGKSLITLLKGYIDGRPTD